MSLTKVLPYFRDCLCSIGLEEWVTERESEDPPNGSNEDYFRLTIGQTTIDPPRHTSFPLTMPVEVNLYINTYNEPNERLDCFMEKIDEAFCCLLAAETRYGSVLKSVVPTGLRFEAIDSSNDNTLKAVLDFDVQLELEYRV